SPVVAGDPAAGDGDLAAWGGVVPPDGVAAGGQPLIQDRVPGPAGTRPGPDRGVGPRRAGGVGADLDLGAEQARRRVQDQRTGVRADVEQHRSRAGGAVSVAHDIASFTVVVPGGVPGAGPGSSARASAPAPAPHQEDGTSNPLYGTPR